MSYSNGRLPAAALSAIPGSSPRPGGRPLLRADAAAHYRAFHQHSVGHGGPSYEIHEGSMRRAYREGVAQVYARRYWCSRGRCGNAAVPYTSNHGLGIRLDLETQYQRRYMDRHGAAYGWTKHHGVDAPWEWWHVGYVPGLATRAGLGAGPRTIRKGSRGADVRKAQRLLRARRKLNGGKVYNAIKVDGVFGPKLKRAVVIFQRRHHLKADGAIGPATWRALKHLPR